MNIYEKKLAGNNPHAPSYPADFNAKIVLGFEIQNDYSYVPKDNCIGIWYNNGQYFNLTPNDSFFLNVLSNGEDVPELFEWILKNKGIIEYAPTYIDRFVKLAPAPTEETLYAVPSIPGDYGPYDVSNVKTLTIRVSMDD